MLKASKEMVAFLGNKNCDQANKLKHFPAINF